MALDPDIKAVSLGEAELLRDGEHVALIAIGHMVPVAMEAASMLQADGILAAVLNARFVKPLDIDKISALAQRCGAVVTLEEHSLLGGFGAAVLEGLSERAVGVPVRRLGIPDQLVEHGESLASLGLDAAGVVRAVAGLLAQGDPR